MNFNNIIDGFDWIEHKKIKSHEEYIVEKYNELYNYFMSGNTMIPAIIICSKTFVIIDGHHRFSVMTRLKIDKIPCLLINYFDSTIVVNPDNTKITKESVINAAISNNLLPPKSTKHVLLDHFNKFHLIEILSPMVSITIK